MKIILTRYLLVAAIMNCVFYSACQKSINEPIAKTSRNQEKSQMRESGITPYQFERINEHNFSSKGWKVQQVNVVNGLTIFADSSDFMEIVCGPENNSDPRLIKGSVTMNFPNSANPTLRNIRLRKSGYSGTRLADLTELKYSTYVVQNAPATMVLQIDVNGDEALDFNIVYNQNLQGPNFPPVVPNTWQQWDPLHQGTWRLQNLNLTLQEIITAYPSARIIDVPPIGNNGEGIRLNIGGPLSRFDNTIGYFDALIIGTKNQQHSTFFDFTCSQ